MDARGHEQLRGGGSGGRRPQAPQARAPASGRAATPVPAAVPSLAKDADAQQQQKRRKQRPPKSLLLLLKSFVGLRVRIDLKNDCVIEGIVEEVVHDMDFTMLDACETKPNGSMVRMDEVFVMGKTVLYVHIPDRINITQHLLQYTRMVKQSATMYTRTKRKSSSRPT
ncbi:uncharacterized protein PITG_11108 [Globisporangium polare]